MHLWHRLAPLATTQARKETVKTWLGPGVSPLAECWPMIHICVQMSQLEAPVLRIEKEGYDSQISSKHNASCWFDHKVETDFVTDGAVSAVTNQVSENRWFFSRESEAFLTVNEHNAPSLVSVVAIRREHLKCVSGLQSWEYLAPTVRWGGEHGKLSAQLLPSPSARKISNYRDSVLLCVTSVTLCL